MKFKIGDRVKMELQEGECRSGVVCKIDDGTVLNHKVRVVGMGEFWVPFGALIPDNDPPPPEPLPVPQHDGYKAIYDEEKGEVRYEEVEEDLSVEIEDFPTVCTSKRVYLLCRRSQGEYRHKGLALSRWYDWKIVTDSRGKTVLVPTQKPTKQS